MIFVPNFPAPAEPVVYPTEGEGGPSVQDVSRGAFRADDGLLSGLYFSLYWFQSESNIITYTVYIYMIEGLLLTLYDIDVWFLWYPWSESLQTAALQLMFREKIRQTSISFEG